ncbi:MAG TPA: hypothetical protein VKT82_18555 [Ktedonobacterales bacterium]|nr:hypothetical protein [Ktedonobacterales bacterium]
MASAGIFVQRPQKVILCLAAALLLAGMLAMLLISGGIPTAHAAGPVLTASTSTTNPGGDVIISGTGWAPAKHYNLYVYGQAKCKPNPICAPPSTSKPINSSPQPIKSDGSFGNFDFSFIANAATTTYVFTVVADYPAGSPYMASVLVQVVPKGTPPSGTPVSSSPAAGTGTTPTSVPASPTKAHQAGGTGTGNPSSTTPTSSSGSNTLAIIVVTLLLLIGIAVLVGLLIVLPPKRRAIRASWYGAGGTSSAGSAYYGSGGTGSTGGRRYGASGPMYGASGPAASGPRRATGGSMPPDDPDPPAWMGGVAQWDDPSRTSRPRPPRRPQGGNY